MNTFKELENNYEDIKIEKMNTFKELENNNIYT
jgi:hypothetical protein